MKPSNDILRELRTKAGKTQDYMAQAIDMNASEYNRLESGKRKIQIKHILKIAKAVEKPIAEVLLNMNGLN